MNSIELKLDNKQDDKIYVLFLYNNLFKAQIDGKDINIEKDDIGRMVIDVPAGQHNVVIRYTEPFMMAGIAIMILGILGIFIIWMLYKKKNMLVVDIEKKENNKEIEQ